MRVRTSWPRRNYALREGDLRRLRLRHRLPHCAADVLDVLVCRDIPDAKGLRKGYCWPSVAYIQAEAGHGCRRTTQRGIADLARAGLIEVVDDTGRGHTSIYVIRWDRLCPGGPGAKGDTDPGLARGQRVTDRPRRSWGKDLKPAQGGAMVSATPLPCPAQRPPEGLTASQRARWIADALSRTASVEQA